jgi:hypothetical protein
VALPSNPFFAPYHSDLWINFLFAPVTELVPWKCVFFVPGADDLEPRKTAKFEAKKIMVVCCQCNTKHDCEHDSEGIR